MTFCHGLTLAIVYFLRFFYLALAAAIGFANKLLVKGIKCPASLAGCKVERISEVYAVGIPLEGCHHAVRDGKGHVRKAAELCERVMNRRRGESLLTWTE